MSETILVVDDEENIRHTLRGVLADEGFEVLEAPDGRRALELLRHAAPRLAIVDVWMPEMDGIELVERMRNQAPGVPIIVISGHGTIETAVRVIRLGAFDFLEKPFPLDALLGVIGRALGTNAAAAETAALAAAGPAPSLAPARRFPERTIGRSVLVNGQGLHSGARTGLILQPLPPGSGIVFGSILSGESVPALVDHVDSTGYATTLVRGGMVAKTVEHLMATLHGYGVTNLLVKMQAEVPILDGSALELCALLEERGRVNNCILVGKEGVVNAPLRFPDEFVRHKILDIFGDFYLLGRPLRGRVSARMTGHSDNAALLGVLRARFGVPALKGA